MKKVIITTVAAIIGLAIFMYMRLGMYKKVEFKSHEVGPLQTLFLVHTGPYYKIAEKIDQVEAWAKAHNVACEKTFGEYLDDPKQVSEDRLQSHGGCLLSPDAKFDAPADMQRGTIAKRNYLIADFDGAPSVGPYAVYPKAFDWMKENKKNLDGPIIEVYTVTGLKSVTTTYLFPIK